MRSRSSRDSHIRHLSSLIADLSAELDRLLSISDPEDTPTPPPLPPPPPRDFIIGDRVENLNTYKNLRGARGYVTGVDTRFIYFTLDSGLETSRIRRNLRRL